MSAEHDHHDTEWAKAVNIVLSDYARTLEELVRRVQNLEDRMQRDSQLHSVKVKV